MSPASTVYLVDGNAYIYRAYHAITPLSNKEGLPTHAVYGFTNILLRVLKEKSPTYLAIAFDAKGRTFRHQIYSQYKSNRPPMPEDLVVQIPYIKEIVKHHNILTMEQSGVEADDLLASAALSLAAQGHQIIIVSGDKDLLQLVSPSISIWDPMLDRYMDQAAVRKKYNVTPAQLTDFFALMGDKSDNVPGVPGIGPKSAEKLINEFSSLDGLYENIDTLKQSKMKENLIANKEAALLSRELIRLKEDISLPDAIENYTIPPPNNAELARLYAFLDFSRLLQNKQETAQLDTADFHLITSNQALQDLAEKLSTTPYLVIDTETTSLDTLTAELVGLSLAAPEAGAYYIPIAHQTENGDLLPNQLSLSSVRALIGPLLADASTPKLGHNLKFDYGVLKSNGLTLSGPLWDTMIASYLIDPTRRSHKLDTLCIELLSIKPTSFVEVTKASKRTDSFRFVPLEEAKNYSCEDVAATRLLWQLFEPQLNELNLWPLFSHIETPLIPVLADMEQNGICLNTDLLQELSAEFSAQLEKLTQKIYTIAGGEFNINSPGQLAEILFERLQLPRGRKTKTGYSTDMKVLEKLATLHELPQSIIEHRNLSKLKSTYVDKLPTMVHPKSGRLHTSFNQTVTATGRLSSSEPNLQNIPIRTEEGQRIRAAFIPAPGCRFIAADYSQIDLRVLAHYSQDPALVQAFCNREDIHQQTAAEIFMVNPNFVTSQMRRVAKSINFGIVYGMSAFGLSEQLKISRKEAATFIERYFRHFHGVKTFMDEIIAKARISGFVTTLLGRRRYLPDINSPNKNSREFAERTALNTPIQGTAADIIKLASIKVASLLSQENLQARMLLQIHDELVFEAPEEELEETAEIVKQTMESVLDLQVPLIVNVSLSDNLAKA